MAGCVLKNDPLRRYLKARGKTYDNTSKLSNRFYIMKRRFNYGILWEMGNIQGGLLSAK